MAEERFYCHGILLPGDSLISELEDCTPGVNTDLLTGYASGHPHPLFRGARAQVPDVQFTCPAVGQILAAILDGGNNYCVDLGASGNTDVGYRKGQNKGIRAADGDSVHERIRFPDAWMYWTSISARHQQDATIAARIVGRYDGTNAPASQVGSGSLSGTPAAVQWYTQGPMKLNGSWLDNEQGFTLSSGVREEVSGSHGDVWPTFLGIQQTDPEITLDTQGKPWSAYGLTGSALTSLDVFLRAKTVDGHNVADATASHIKIAVTNGYVVPDRTSGGQTDPATNQLRIALRAPDGNSGVMDITVGETIA
jgi:hypothetical protein